MYHSNTKIYSYEKLTFVVHSHDSHVTFLWQPYRTSYHIKRLHNSRNSSYITWPIFLPTEIIPGKLWHLLSM